MSKVSLFGPMLAFTLTFSAGRCRIVLSPVQNRIDDRPLMLVRPLGTAMISIRLELLPASFAASGAIALFDPLIDLRAKVVFVVVISGAMVFAAAGGVAGFLTFAEVALWVGRTAVVGSAVAVVFAAAGGVTGFLTFAEIALWVRRTAVVLLARITVWSTFSCTAGRITRVLTFDKVAFRVVACRPAVICFFVVSALITSSGVARLLPGDQSTGSALVDRLRKGEGERRH